MLFGIKAWAADFSYTSDETDNIYISGTSQPDTRVSLRVLFLGNSEEPMTITPSLLQEHPEVLNHIDQTKAGSDGKFNIDFQIVGTKGFYMIHLQDEKKDLGYEILFHFTDEDVKEAVKELWNYAKTKSETETIEYLDGNYKICRINDDEYVTLKAEGYLPMLINVLKNADSVENASELKQMTDTAVFLKDFYSAANAQAKETLISENETLLKLDTLNNYKKLFKEVYSETERHSIINAFSETKYYQIPEFVSEFNEAIVLGGIEYGNWITVQKVIESNSEIFNSQDYTQYINLVASKSSKAADIVKELTGKRFTDVGEVSSAFTVAVKKYTGILVSGNVNYGGGGGGGGSSSNGGTRLNITTPQAPAVSNNNPEDEKTKSDTMFTDLGTALWAESSITKLASAGVISGKGDGTFAPGDNVTREEFLTMLIRGLKIKIKSGDISFSDVVSGAWYEEYVMTAFENGIVSGISETEFGTGRYITRQDMAVMAVRAAENNNMILKKDDAGEGFKDADTISDYAKDAVQILRDSKIVSGMEDGSFMPMNLCTRAEAAVIIDRLISFEY